VPRGIFARSGGRPCGWGKGRSINDRRGSDR